MFSASKFGMWVRDRLITQEEATGQYREQQKYTEKLKQYEKWQYYWDNCKHQYPCTASYYLRFWYCS